MENIKGNYGYSTGGYTIAGLQRLSNTSGEIRDGWREKRKQKKRSDEEIEALKESFFASGMTLRAYCRTHDVAYNTLWYHVNNKPSKYVKHPKPSIWTEENLKYFIEHYAETSNAELAERFGCKVSTIQKRAYFLGLHKTDEVRAKNAEKARLYTKTEEAKAKQARGWKKAYEADKRRLLFGMEQKTKIRVGEQKTKTSLKANMKFKNGYFTLTRMSNTLYWNENTRRSTYREQRAKEVGLIVKQWNENQQ